MEKVAQAILGFVRDIFKIHKLKIFTVVFSALLFFVMLFPFDDLSDLVTEKVAVATNNQVFLTFERLNLSLFPGP